MKLGKSTRFKSTKQRTAYINNKIEQQYQEKKEKEIVSLTTPTDEVIASKPDDIKLFLDDERPCPEGWTLVKSHREFFSFLEDPDNRAKISRISFDWYLGSYSTDGVYVVRQLVENFFEDHGYLPHLKAVNFHSSDRDRAVEMAGIFREIEKELPSNPAVRVRLGHSV